MPGDLLANLVVFARALRAAGVAARAGGVADAADALALLGVARRQDVHDAVRATLLFKHDDYAVFDRLFEQFWRVWPESSAALPRPIHVPPRSRSTLRIMAAGAASAGPDDVEAVASDEPVGVPTYSPDEVWRRKDFAAFTPDDLAHAAQALAMLAWTPGLRVTRRWVAGPGRIIDLRRLMRANAARGADLFSIPYRVRRVAPRPLVLICDVSGSMEPYTRMLLLFAHAMAAGRRRVEVFVFSTRLTRVDATVCRGTRRCCPRARARGGQRLVRRHQNWRRHPRLQRYVATSCYEPRSRGAADFRRLGSRRSRRCSRARRPGCSAARIGWSGSIRCSDRPVTSRWRAACARRCRSSTTSCRFTTWRAWKGWPSD